MEKRIELEKRGRNPADIKELILDNCRSIQIVGLTEEFCNLEVLSLINVGLTNLKGFPKLPNLKKLELSDNRISGGLNHLSGSPNLNILNLSGNKIEGLEELEPLKEFASLKQLDLYNCNITAMENYKEKVFALLTGLVYLDGYDVNGKELVESEEENGVGPSKKVIDVDDDSEDISDLEDEEEDEDEDEDDDEEEEVGLSYLQNTIDEESEGEDYNPEGGNDDSDVDIEDDAEEDEKNDKPKGQKRKLEDDDE